MTQEKGLLVLLFSGSIADRHEWGESYTLTVKKEGYIEWRKSYIEREENTHHVIPCTHTHVQAHALNED